MMKTLIIGISCVMLCSTSVLPPTAEAQPTCAVGGCHADECFIDADGDGICGDHNFIDENNDGICDNHCYIDENTDGICDYFTDDDADGICDHCHDHNKPAQTSCTQTKTQTKRHHSGHGHHGSHH